MKEDALLKSSLVRSVREEIGAGSIPRDECFSLSARLFLTFYSCHT